MDSARWSRCQRRPGVGRLCQGCAAVERFGGAVRKQTKTEGKSGWEPAKDWTREDFIERPARGEARRRYSRTLRRNALTTLLILLATMAGRARRGEAPSPGFAGWPPVGECLGPGPSVVDNGAAAPPRRRFVGADLF